MWEEIKDTDIRFIQRCLLEMPQKEFNILELFFLKKRGIKEIAELYDCSQRTVTRNINRGLKRLSSEQSHPQPLPALVKISSEIFDLPI
jgi:RNA polymerase sigma factor (sigma-70 family)